MKITITRNVKMKSGAEKLELKAPFYPTFPKAARELGGTWSESGQAWYFDPRDESRVRDLCRETYGTDGLEEPDLVDVRVALDEYHDDYRSIWRYGRLLAKRPYRDSSVRLGEGVIVVEGGFPSSGGSMKHPRLETREGTVLEVRDVPATLVNDTMPGVEIVRREEKPAFRADEYLAARLSEEEVEMAKALAAMPASRVAAILDARSHLLFARDESGEDGE